MAEENHRQNNKNIKAISVNDIHVTYSNDCEILKIASNYYAELFSSKIPNDENVNEYLQNVNLPTLNQDLCEGLITRTECEIAVNRISLQGKMVCQLNFIQHSGLRLVLFW